VYNVVETWILDIGSSCGRAPRHPTHTPDIGSHACHVVIQLVVTTRESAYDRLRNGLRVEVNVPERGRFVLVAVIEKDRCLFRQRGAYIGQRVDIFAGPSTFPTNGAAIRKMPPMVCLGGSSTMVRIKIVPPIEWPMRMALSSSPPNHPEAGHAPLV